RARRDADHRARFARPRVLTVGTRAYVQRVLQHAWNGAVVFGCNEEDRVCGPDALPQRLPGLGRIGVLILVVERQLPDLDDLELQVIRRQGSKRLGHLTVIGVLAQPTDEDRHIPLLAHLNQILAEMVWASPSTSSEAFGCCGS